jgi:hypothetical protein
LCGLDEAAPSVERAMDFVSIALALATFAVLLALIEGLDRV